MPTNPFNKSFAQKMSYLDAIIAKDFENYSRLPYTYGYSPLPEDPEDSFERTTDTIRFNEKIWGTEDGD